MDEAAWKLVRTTAGGLRKVRMNRIQLFLTAAILLATLPVNAQQQRADLILFNGVIHTMNPAQPEAHALAVRGGLITSVGEDQSVLSIKSDGTKLIDLNGKTVVPGFMECHAHLVSLGMSLQEINVRGMHSEAQVVETVGKVAKRL